MMGVPLFWWLLALGKWFCKTWNPKWVKQLTLAMPAAIAEAIHPHRFSHCCALVEDHSGLSQLDAQTASKTHVSWRNHVLNQYPNRICLRCWHPTCQKSPQKSAAKMLTSQVHPLQLWMLCTWTSSYWLELLPDWNHPCLVGEYRSWWRNVHLNGWIDFILAGHLDAKPWVFPICWCFPALGNSHFCQMYHHSCWLHDAVCVIFQTPKTVRYVQKTIGDDCSSQIKHFIHWWGPVMKV